MKLKRLLERVRHFIDADERERRSERDEIRTVLKKLKKVERKLKHEVAETNDFDARSALESKLKVVHAQRKKGIEALKASKRSSKSAKAS